MQAFGSLAAMSALKKRGEYYQICGIKFLVVDGEVGLGWNGLGMKWALKLFLARQRCRGWLWVNAKLAKKNLANTNVVDFKMFLLGQLYFRTEKD